jgi:hypothetical protein
MANGRFDEHEVGRALEETARALDEFAERGLLDELAELTLADDAQELGELIGRDRRFDCSLVCDYVCTLRCHLICIEVVRAEPTEDPGLRGLREFARRLGSLGDEALKKLVAAVANRDSGSFGELTAEHGLERYQHFLCYWICSLDCRLHCEGACFGGSSGSQSTLLDEVRRTAHSLGKLASDQSALKDIYEAAAETDAKRLRAVFERLDLFEPCRLLCAFFCFWRCFWLCRRLCQRFPLKIDQPREAIVDFSKQIAELGRSGALDTLHDALAAADSDRWAEILEEFGLARYCHWVCLWVCRVRCRIFCQLVCPPPCEILRPQGCVQEQTFSQQGIFQGVAIYGTAAGSSCHHYTLEWREAGAGPWRSDGIQYPSGNPTGSCGIIGGLLGWLATFPSVPAGPVELRLCIHRDDEDPAPTCCTATFELQRRMVWIRGVEGIDAEVPPGVLDPPPSSSNPHARLVDGSGNERSFGNRVRVFGTAWLAGCDVGKLRRYTLSYHQGFVDDPTLAGFVRFWQVEFDHNAFQEAYRDNNPINEEALTSEWRRQRICLPPPPGCITVGNYLQASRWNTKVPELHHVEPKDPPSTPSPASWSSTELPLPNCQSGRFTLRLTAEDVGGNVFHDLQRVWFDNKELNHTHAMISQFDAIKPCEVVNLSRFAVDGGDCNQAWTAQLLGRAFDDYIEEGNASPPSDNFGGYRLWVKKDGAPSPGASVPIPGPGSPPWSGPFVGTSRVGFPDPSDRCTNPQPPTSYPAGADGILAVVDMRRFDAACNPSEPNLTLKRGECCDYVLTLKVWDESICPGLSGGHHERTHTFPFRLCNDLD